MNLLRKGLYRPVLQKRQKLKLAEGKSTHLQGQILHISAQRNIRLPLSLTRLSDEKTEKRILYTINIYS